MAFKILNEEEISLLNADQLEYYEKELEIYKQREAFVEKLTKLENAEIKPYKPDLKPIDVIGGIELSPFTRPERQKLNLKPAQKPELSHKLTGKANGESNISKVVTLSPVLKERVNFDKRLFSKADHFRSYEQEQYKEQYTLPAFSRPVIPDAAFAKLENVLSEPVQAIGPVEWNVKPFNAPDKSAIVLSKVSKPEIRTGAFVKPNIQELDIEVNIKSETALKSFEKPGFAMTALPEIPKVNTNISAFRQPERNRPEIAVNAKSDFRIGAFKLPDTTITDLPQMKWANAEVKSFENPEFKAVELPDIHKIDIRQVGFHAPEKPEFKFMTAVIPSIDIKSYEMPQEIKTELPDLPKINTNIGSFTKLQKIKPKLKTQEKVLKPITNFKKPESVQPELSDIKVCIGFEIGTKAQDVLSLLNREAAL